jgi:alkanesulfonate monooxygenase SsuD/methylene tetrahydromethanopterin reductase-like flavin-dependent oxidoreductase (luciferase family)
VRAPSADRLGAPGAEIRAAARRHGRLTLRRRATAAATILIRIIGHRSALESLAYQRAEHTVSRRAAMKFGLFGGARARGGPTGDSEGYHDFIRYVIAAEELGFSSVFLVEHHFTGFGQVSASLNLLSYLAARTDKIRLGTAVVVLPWHNPVLVAEEAATLDLLSNGRLDFGVGKGYRPYEFSGFCIEQDEATARFDEAIDVIRKAWTSKGRFSYEGRWWRYDNIVVEPAPIQQPHPPFWMGAGSPESIRRAAREGCNLLLDQIAPVEIIIERVRVFREECRAVGRRYDPMMVGVTRGLQIVHNDEERRRAILTRREVLKNIGDLARGPGAERYHQIKDDPDNFELDDAPLLGTPEEILERLKRLEAGGVENVLFAAPGASIAGLRTFAEEIMPAFDRSPMALAQV